VLGWVALGGALLYGGAVLRSLLTRDLASSGYPSPEAAETEIEALAAAHPTLCQLQTIGASTQGRPIRALRLRGRGRDGGEGAERPRLLVTAHIHAVEFVGSFVARAVARRLVEGYERDAGTADLLDRAEVWLVPLLNPDGARRVWEKGGLTSLGGSRFTARGVDPNRNFPYVELRGRRAWNSGRNRPGSAYYRGPQPLSEPECAALARLCRRERFCGAINFHSFGCVVYMPALGDAAQARARHALEVFRGEFQWRQPRVRYRPVPERSAAITGQLDAFLLAAFGTPSVTVEVSRPGWHVLKPDRIGSVFWIANPERPERWAENDVEATVHALRALLERTCGRPCTPTHPELGQAIPAEEGARPQ
jgi:hypothetical protein